MARPDFLQSVVDQMVASARPDAAPASSSPSVLPLRNAPRRLTGKQISVSSVTVTLSVPGGQTLIDFPLGTVLTTSQIPVTLTLGEGTYDMKFEPSLLIQVDPSRLQSQAASLLLKLAADVVEATFGLNEIRYTSASRSATCNIVPWTSPDPDTAAKLRASVKTAIEQQVSDYLQFTHLGDPIYSFIDDPDIPATLVTALNDMLAEKDRRSEPSVWVPAAIKDTLVEKLLKPTPHVDPSGMFITSVSANLRINSQVAASGRVGRLLLQPGNIAVSASLHANLGMLLQQGAGARLLSNVSLLGFSGLSLEGFVQVLANGIVAATFSGLRVATDGSVTISGVQVSREAQQAASVAGVNLFEAERTVNSIVGAIMAMLQVAAQFGDAGSLNAVASQNPAILANRAIRGLAANNQSVVLEPLATDFAKASIERELTDSVSDMLQDSFEGPFGVQLRELFGGVLSLSK
jgi:hypothetical protein